MSKAGQPKEPETRGELQDCANLAHAFLLLHSARVYGLVTGGPGVNVERATELLARAKAAGIHPQQSVVDGIIGHWAAVNVTKANRVRRETLRRMEQRR